MTIKIIRATPGPTTTQRILELIHAHPEGMSIRELSDRLNRPVSMVNHCLKLLRNSQQVYGRLSKNQMQQVYSRQQATK